MKGPPRRYCSDSSPWREKTDGESVQSVALSPLVAERLVAEIPRLPVALGSGLSAEGSLAASAGEPQGPWHQYMSPPPPIPAELFSPLPSGISQTMASVVSSSDAMDAAFCKA